MMTRAQETIACVVALVLAGLLLAWGAWTLYGHGYDTGALAEREKTAKAITAATDKLRAAHAAEVKRLAGIHQQVNEKVSHDHDQAIADLRRERAADIRDAERRGGLRISAGVCRDTSGTLALAEGALRHHEETAGTIRLPQQVEADLWALAGDADEVTEQLRACQAWITASGFYGQPATN